MTEHDAIKQLGIIAAEYARDKEVLHTKVDEVLLDLLRSMGHDAVADAYEDLSSEFWYA